jgi:clusterin-associated protein 1
MSFRELRNFTEIMRSLGYPRRISVESFREPNFELVADCLLWMARKYDPMMPLLDDIDSPDDRISFVNSMTANLLSRGRIKLNGKRLYRADGRAVKELLKLATVLNASNKAGEEDLIKSVSAQLLGGDQETEAMKGQDIKSARLLASEITERGAKLFDLLDGEVELRMERETAAGFLHAISAASAGSAKEVNFVERKVKEMTAAASSSLEATTSALSELSMDEKGLDTKIGKKTAELQRNEKRLKSLKTVRPAFMDEYEMVEQQLQRHYAEYLIRFRNCEYLEHELQLMQAGEAEYLKEGDRQLKRLQKKLRNEELRLLRDGGGQAGKESQNASRQAGSGGRGGRRVIDSDDEEFEEVRQKGGDERKRQARPQSAGRSAAGRGGSGGAYSGGGGSGRGIDSDEDIFSDDDGDSMDSRDDDGMLSDEGMSGSEGDLSDDSLGSSEEDRTSESGLGSEDSGEGGSSDEF